MQRCVLCLLDLLHELRVLGDQLPQVGKFLQQLGEEECVVRVVGQQVELQHVHDALLHALDAHHVHQARAVLVTRERELTLIELMKAFCILYSRQTRYLWSKILW